jgi:hypothetical protein
MGFLGRLWRKFTSSDFVRRVFSSRRFRDSDTRRIARPPTVEDMADVDVRQVSGDEYVVVISQGQSHLANRLDGEMRSHQQRENPFLPEGQRPTMQDLAKIILDEAENNDEDDG